VKATEIIELINHESFEVVEADGYQLLAMAMLERALLDVYAIRFSNETEQLLQRTRSRALDWFLVDRSGFTFSMVCDLLGVERDRMLAKVKAHIEGKHVSTI
jgi:hypothetical protein